MASAVKYTRLTASQVNKEGPVEVLVIDQSRMLPGTAAMLQGKVHLPVTPKYVATLLIQE